MTVLACFQVDLPESSGQSPQISFIRLLLLLLAAKIHSSPRTPQWVLKPPLGDPCLLWLITYLWISVCVCMSVCVCACTCVNVCVCARARVCVAQRLRSISPSAVSPLSLPVTNIPLNMHHQPVPLPLLQNGAWSLHGSWSDCVYVLGRRFKVRTTVVPVLSHKLCVWCAVCEQHCVQIVPVPCCLQGFVKKACLPMFAESTGRLPTLTMASVCPW